MTSEEKLQKAAKTYSDYRWGYLNELQPSYEESVKDWIEGAKSEDAAAYHKEKNKWKNKEEIAVLIRKYEDDMSYYGRDRYYNVDSAKEKWIEENL